MLNLAIIRTICKCSNHNSPPYAQRTVKLVQLFSRSGSESRPPIDFIEVIAQAARLAAVREHTHRLETAPCTHSSNIYGAATAANPTCCRQHARSRLAGYNPLPLLQMSFGVAMNAVRRAARKGAGRRPMLVAPRPVMNPLQDHNKECRRS
jgi:hypothetical protein